MLKKTAPKILSDIQSEWDAMCSNRQRVIDSGKDFSLISVTSPCIIQELGTDPVDSILDFGCGTGYLTSLLAKHTSKCVGVDISANSIALAQSRYASSGAQFVASPISDYRPNIKFDVCVANMVLSCDPDWVNSIRAIYGLLAKDGKLLVMIPHPCNWAKYWGFEDAQWFQYNQEVYIEHDFSVSLAKSLGTATYIHRPLSAYVTAICGEKFYLEKMVEPFPTEKLPGEYRYDYPRFLFMKFVKK